METSWIIQSTGFASSNILETIDILNELNIDWKDYGIVKNTITNLENILEEDRKLIARGGIKLIKLIENSNNIYELNKNISKEQKNYKFLKILKESIDYDEKKFDQKNYMDKNLPLLNKNAEIIKYEDLKYRIFEKDKFIKPSRDLKSFDGGIIYENETILNFLMRNKHTEEVKNEDIIISDLKDIKNEYRFFIYKENILGSSQYMENGKLHLNQYVPEKIKQAAKEYSKLYNPKEIFVMDLCELEKGEIKIVEYNCWNASAFYHTEAKKIISKINEIKGSF